MQRLTKQQLLAAFAKTIVAFGLIHYVVLGVYAFTTASIDPLNFFRVLSLDLFYKAWGQGVLNFTVSYLLFLAVLLFFVAKRD